MTIYNSTYPAVDVSKARRSIFEHLFDVPYGDFKAFIDGLDESRFITAKDLRSLSLRLAWGLRNKLPSLCSGSVARGDVVMVFSPNSIEYPVALLGAVAAGLRVTLANAAYTPAELAHQYKDSNAKHIFVHPALTPIVIESLQLLSVTEKEARSRIILLAFPDRIGAAHQGWIQLSDLIGTQDMQPERFDGAQSNETVYLCYSSGTTGLSKGVETTHYNIASLCSIVEPVLRLDHGKDVVLGVLPFFHIFGLAKIIHYCLFCGVPVVVLPRFQLDTFCHAIQHFRTTFIYVVPPILVLLATNPVVDQYDFSSLRMLMSGAAPLGAELAGRTQSRLRSRGGSVFVVQGYGLTETSPTTHVLVPADAARKPGSVGKLLPNLQARLVQDNGSDARLGEPGELWIRGPSVMKGYLNNKEATRASITQDSWFKTGDVGLRDGEGFYYIVDRKKELIKYKGFQVPPADLESLLLSHPNVEDAAVIGVQSKAEATELPRGYIVPKGGLKLFNKKAQQEIADGVQAWVREKVANHKQLRGGVFCIEAIPKSASGKILRRHLRDMAEKEVENSFEKRARL